ncbi:MAG TPA: geranylgeranyl reductase family protein [Chthonomonadaceae bacterium]|nr:geranylgeranyl reductase family protein [Chthonomonadaceae bacterium]
MPQYDAVVVGAGPAGCAAAFDLARAGARVALIEKHALPRHKTCGGGMPMAVEQVLALDTYRDLAPEAFVEADTRFMRHTWQFGQAVLAPLNPDPNEPRQISLWMVRRSVFDNALAQRAAAAGAELRDGLAVRSIDRDADGAVRVTADGRAGGWSGTAGTVIGADGANGVVARSSGLRRNRALAIAIEAEVPHAWGDGHVDLRPDVCHLEYGAVERGYAWVFPKGDHINVGAGVFRPKQAGEQGDNTVRADLRRAIMDYLDMLGVPRREDELTFHAHPLPIWNGLDKLQSADARVLLAGDAAGLINPFFGDGILHALKSGQIAACAVLEGSQRQYTQAIGREFRTNFDSALKLAKFFYQWPRFCYQHGVRRPGATRTAARLLCGDAVFTDVAGRVLRRLRQALVSGADEPSPVTE